MGSLLDNYFWWLPFGSVPEVTAEDLKRELAKTRGRPQLLDVRTDREWRAAAIKGTVLMPIGILAGQIGRLPFEKSLPVVAICRSAHRSIPAVRLLRRAGFQDVRQLQGGMMAWERNGYATIRTRD